MKKIKNKAFLGTIFNAIGNLVTAKKEQDLKQKQYEQQQGLIYKQEANQLANTLTQELQNQEGYVDAMKNRITFNRLGGEHKTKRIKKKKSLLGTINAIGDSIGGAINMIGSLTNKPKDYTLKYSDVIQAQTPKIIKTPNDIVQQTNLAMQQFTNPQMRLNQVQNPILSQAKLGAKRVKQKNLNRFK